MYKSPLATRASDVNDIRVRLAAILSGCCFALFASIMPLTLARAADSLGLVEWEMGLLGGANLSVESTAPKQYRLVPRLL